MLMLSYVSNHLWLVEMGNTDTKVSTDSSVSFVGIDNPML